MHNLILPSNHRHVGAINERMQNMNCLMKSPGLCVAVATTLHQVPHEENIALCPVRPNHISMRYSVRKTQNLSVWYSAEFSDSNQMQEHYTAVLALTFWRLLFHCLR